MLYDGVLKGVTVLDCSRVLAGPYSCMMMADMGADVIKIERPGVGDDSRGWMPMVNDSSIYFLNLNRGKRSITINMKSPEGKKVFLELVKKADILVENFRPGTMDRLGLGYDVLKEVNPRLVYGCVSGFGHYGPYSNRPGYDIIAQAMGGIMSVTGWPGGEATRTGTAIADVLAGLSVTIGILAAFTKARETGKGQKVDVSLVDSVVSAMENINQIYLADGRVPTRIGNRYEASYPYDAFQAKDGSFVIGCGNDSLFKKLSALMGMPELNDDPRFCTNKLRVINHAPLKEIMNAWLADKTVAEAVDLILGAGVPAGPILSIDQIAEDPHIVGARNMFVEIDHPIAGRQRITGNQIKFSDDPIKFERTAPLLGQHSEEILKEFLGYTDEQIAALQESDAL